MKPRHGGLRGFGFLLGGTITAGEGSPASEQESITPGRAQTLQIAQVLTGTVLTNLVIPLTLLLWAGITARHLPSLGRLIVEPDSGERGRPCLRVRLLLS